MKINKAYQAFKIFFKVLGLDKRIDSYFRLQDFVGTIGPLHFDSTAASPAEKAAFFRSRLKDIEVETHAYCNRKCSFCPNASVDRTDKTKVMREDVFRGMIDELGKMDFDGCIKFHRFNEPLALDIIFDRVEYARKRLSRAVLGLHSNGDYVTKNILERLDDMGVDFFGISRYIDFNAPRFRVREAARRHCEDYLKRLGLRAAALRPDNNLARYKIPMRRMKVTLFVPDIIGRGNDRGGHLKDLKLKKPRTSPCRSPFSGLYIDWTGDVLPCCNLRGDIEAQKSFVMGNIREDSLQDVFLSKASGAIRKMLIDHIEKPGPCKYCGYDLFYIGRRAKKLIDAKIKSLL
jgi:radical SAM protein with 4Fe4S-binding SPASM domain